MVKSAGIVGSGFNPLSNNQQAQVLATLLQTPKSYALGHGDCRVLKLLTGASFSLTHMIHTHTFSHRQPKLCESSLDFEFTRECMKINKIRPKFHFSTKIEIKMTYIVFVFCYLLSLRL